MDTIHLAIYKAKDFTLQIEYEFTDGGNAIEITNFHIAARPITDFEQRERTRRGVQRLHNETDNPEHVPALRFAHNDAVRQTDTLHALTEINQADYRL